MSNGNVEPELYEFYWIKIKEIEGKPFGKILKIINQDVYVIKLWTALNKTDHKLKEEEFVIARYLIGEKISNKEMDDYNIWLWK